MYKAFTDYDTAAEEYGSPRKSRGFPGPGLWLAGASAFYGTLTTNVRAAWFFFVVMLPRGLVLPRLLVLPSWCG